MPSTLFKSFWMGGFECSTHKRSDGKRLDLLAATKHDRFFHNDYLKLKNMGLQTMRDGLRWHLIEQRPYEYDWSQVVPMLKAADELDIEIIWDICHYGWPDDLNIFSSQFALRFAEFATAFVKLHTEIVSLPPRVTLINEISFLSWAAGEVGLFFPYAKGRAAEIKRQLVSAEILATEFIRDIAPQTRFIHTDPLIHVVPGSSDAEQVALAAAYNQAQYEALDMLTGRIHPELGGQKEYLDILGMNYYIHNQWVYPGGHGTMIDSTDPRHRPVWQLLEDTYKRYRRPIFITETSIEDEARPQWLKYMANEVRVAITAGVPVQGICLYPIVNHPGWDNERHCHNGLWDYADEIGKRAIYAPLSQELKLQQQISSFSCQSEFIQKLTQNEEQKLQEAACSMEVVNNVFRAAVDEKGSG